MSETKEITKNDFYYFIDGKTVLIEYGIHYAINFIPGFIKMFYDWYNIQTQTGGRQQIYMKNPNDLQILLNKWEQEQNLVFLIKYYNSGYL